MIVRAAGLLAGYLADLAFADPRRGHPVAGFGAVAAALERADYRDDRAAGAGHVVVLLGALAVLATAAPKRGGWGAVAVGLGTWASLGGRSLARTGARMADLLDSGDIDAARALLPSLCGRDPATLDADGWRAPPWNRWRRTPPTRPSHRCFGSRGRVARGAGLPRRQHS